jgi:N-acetyl-gamma-glutamylphosphate reductase
MKVILSGATGFIGGEVLTQALAHPSITSLICLSRRALPESVTTNPKVKVIIVSDFTSYPPEILAQLEGAGCCIWYVVQCNYPPQQFQPCSPTNGS